MIFSTKPSRRETLWGGIYLLLYMGILPWIVPFVLIHLAPQLNMAQINFLYAGLNFAATTVIFRKFLLKSLGDALRAPSLTLWYSILGYLGNMVLSEFVAVFTLRLYPEFISVNDASINTIAAQNMPLMFIGAVILAPVAEELLFRGLIFRSLYDRKPFAAYVVTMVLFGLIHVTGYVGMYDWKLLLLCFLQYLPAGYCLNFAYRYSGAIAAPILIHMMTNLMAFSAMR